jgi:hypothetical protein
MWDNLPHRQGDLAEAFLQRLPLTQTPTRHPPTTHRLAGSSRVSPPAVCDFPRAERQPPFPSDVQG